MGLTPHDLLIVITAHSSGKPRFYLESKQAELYSITMSDVVDCMSELEERYASHSQIVLYLYNKIESAFPHATQNYGYKNTIKKHALKCPIATCFTRQKHDKVTFAILSDVAEFDLLFIQTLFCERHL